MNKQVMASHKTNGLTRSLDGDEVQNRWGKRAGGRRLAFLVVLSCGGSRSGYLKLFVLPFFRFNFMMSLPCLPFFGWLKLGSLFFVSLDIRLSQLLLHRCSVFKPPDS